MSTVEMPSGLDLSESLYEVVDGTILEKPPLGSYEFDLANVLMLTLTDFVAPRQLGRVWVEMLFDFRPIVNHQRRPDVAFISAQRWPIERRMPRRPSAWRMVPDLAIEIVSPSNLADELEEKIDEYFHVGMSRVWVVYPNTAKVYVYDSPTSVRAVGRGQVLTDEVMFPGFRLDLDKFFGPPDGDDTGA